MKLHMNVPLCALVCVDVHLGFGIFKMAVVAMVTILKLKHIFVLQLQ